MDSAIKGNVYAVILAGGSGTRFWPASRRLRPKQLLPLGPAAPDSLLRATVARLSGLVPPSNVYLATGEHLLEATRAELSEVPEENFLAEPQAKNTAPCIGWAAGLIAARDPDAVLVVLPSDQHATAPARFQEVISRAVAVARSGKIVTIGVVPTRPETGYGYIEVGAEGAQGSREVARFVEKPGRAVAEEYVASGRYLWNAGMFVFRARDMVAALRKHLPGMAAGIDRVVAEFATPTYEASVKDFFSKVESVSIDYGVMEKEVGLAVVPGEFGWSDLGSWESAWELSPKDADGNAAEPRTVLVDAKNNLVSDLSSATGSGKKVIALVGVNDLCVIETDDALLILPRERSQDVRAVVDILKARGASELL